MANLTEVIKKAALEAVNATDPSAITFGTVVSIDPLEIYIDQKLILASEFIILTKNVTDYEITMSFDIETDSVELETEPMEHSHNVGGTHTFTVHNALKVDDKVILLRQQGGQAYIVLDKIGGI